MVLKLSYTRTATTDWLALERSAHGRVLVGVESAPVSLCDWPDAEKTTEVLIFH